MSPYIELRGSARAIGRAKGVADGDYLGKALESYGLLNTPALDRWICDQAIPLTGTTYPALADEIAGYAEGAACDLIDIYRLLFSQVRSRFACSNLAVMTTDVGPVFAKNTDLCPWEGDRIAFFHYIPDRGVPFFGYAYRASFAVQGMNAAGLCNGGTSASGVIENRRALPDTGCPTQFAIRQIVQFGKTLDDAEVQLSRAPFFDKPCGLFFMDRQGQASHVNRSLTICDIRRANERPAVCTGFFRSEDYRWKAGSEDNLRGGRARLAAAIKWFERRPDPSLDDVLTFLRTHGPDPGVPGQWCRHHPDDPHLQTAVSHVCLPAERRILYALGSPCRTAYREFRFG